MAFDLDPTVRSRELGLRLSTAMRAAGFSANEIARKLGWSPSRVSRLLSGKRGVRLIDIAAFLAVCDIIGDERGAVLEIAEHAWETLWWQQCGSRLPERSHTLSFLEDTSSAMIHTGYGMVPALLQTESYMRASLRALPTIPEEEVDSRVAHGLARQEIFDRDRPVRFRFFLHEYAMTRTGHGRRAMSEQLHHLVRMAVRPHVEVRVVAEAPGSVPFEPFRIIEFAEFNPVLYLEDLTWVAFIERADTLNSYRRVVAEIDAVALDRAASRDWLATTAADLASASGRPDADAIG
ncbi:MAG: helix-turn-helix domain-containing protein [Actinophytocola sp.]|uniref:helix-turn-helix domain-containing protein n=1 Tax=Actinophytocola sp. TaxID=1872138 RepID=UPI0013225104|nr:helix-turn-helix transcriptional regulator [Actinophytocola sp.]MPZ85660.1 helix-turn-helix domain-containing protein [Actinophytocola sp.]